MGTAVTADWPTTAAWMGPESETGPGASERAGAPTIPRRSFLGGIAAAGTAPVVRAGGDGTRGNQASSIQDGDDQEVDTHFEFGAEVDGWRGQAPPEIEGETNPALALEPGTTYRMTWVNLDGVDHDFTIRDADENELASTETMSDQGEMRSLTFTATEEMDNYVCTVHPNRMVGTIQVGDETPAGDTPTEADEAVDTHFRLGGQVGGWQGQSPSDVEGETNPTLELEAGREYRVTWENLDGVQHNFAILDAGGTEIESTEIMSLEGETRSLTFTATSEMDQYYCAIHTDRMRGDIQIGDGAPAEDTPTEAAEDIETRYELGGVIDGWQGRLPEERDAENRIEGEVNPTLEFEAGERYVVVWENADGVPHDFTIKDADGNGLLGTEVTDEQGEKLSLTFTASEEMDHYVCTIHPDTMRGDIEVSGGGPVDGGLGDVLGPDPEGRLGAVVVATIAFAAAVAYGLADHFDERYEP